MSITVSTIKIHQMQMGVWMNVPPVPQAPASVGPYFVMTAEDYGWEVQQLF